MAIAFQSATNAGVTTTNATSLAINKPTSTASGDLLVTAMACYLGQTVTTLSGWTLVDSVDGSSGVTTKLYYRVANGSEGSTFTWSFTLTGGNSLVAITCLRFTGTDASTPLGVTTSASNGSISSVTPVALTGAASSSVAVVACGVRPDFAGDPVLSTPSTGNWVANANAKRNSITSSDFDAAIGVSYNLSTASSAPPACTTTANCEFGIISAEFQVSAATSASAGQPAVTAASQVATVRVEAAPNGADVTAAANDATVSTSVNAERADVVAAAGDSTVSLTATASGADVSATAKDADSSPRAEQAAVSATANDATTAQSSSAGQPAAVASAQNATVVIVLPVEADSGTSVDSEEPSNTLEITTPGEAVATSDDGAVQGLIPSGDVASVSSEGASFFVDDVPVSSSDTVSCVDDSLTGISSGDLAHLRSVSRESYRSR